MEIDMKRCLTIVLIIMLLTLTCLVIVLANRPGVIDASGSNDDNVWEVGALYIEKYQANYCTCNSGLSDLCCPRIYAERLISVVSSRGFSTSFLRGNADVTGDLFVDTSLGGRDLIDSVDLFYFVGHSGSYGVPMCVDTTPDKRYCPMPYSYMRLGDRDLEWAIFDSCRSLESLYNDLVNSVWRQVFRGLHAVAGYATETHEPRMCISGVPFTNICYVLICNPFYNRAGEFAKQFTSGKSFAEAWYWATKTQMGRSDVIACVYSPWDPVTANYGMYDAPFANPPVMSRDVTSASSPTWTWMGWCWYTG